MFIFKDPYLVGYIETQGQDYADAVSALLKNYMIPIVMLVVAVGAVLGAYLGKATLKKHFKRAGIA